ncbi:MAG: shikimate dehydrogenase [Bacteroidetes bacterium]|nr:MAG: shikimate dehydrogenase [Bacteroidota bacterium]
MQRYGLIGYPLGHSFSQRYFTEKFAREGISDARYELFPLPDIKALPALIAAHPDLRGLNVTIPHKVTVLNYLDARDDTARDAGAVNVIRIRDGRLEGFNSDVLGLEISLQQLDDGKWLLPATGSGPVALILGTGGAARAVACVLRRAGLTYRIISRQAGAGRLTYDDLHQLDFTEIRLIFNATPLGMYPDTENCPNLPFDKLHAAQLVYDLVYNPTETLLLQRARARGAAVKNGLEMLRLQAEAAWAIWQQE